MDAKKQTLQKGCYKNGHLNGHYNWTPPHGNHKMDTTKQTLQIWMQEIDTAKVMLQNVNIKMDTNKWALKIDTTKLTQQNEHYKKDTSR